MATSTSTLPPNPVSAPALPVRTTRNGWWVTAAAAALLFASGAAVGCGVTLLCLAPRRPPFDPNQTPPQWVDRVVKRLTDDLALSEDQVAKIRPIVQSNTEEMTRLRQQMAPLFTAEVERFGREVESILTTDEQREAWKKRQDMMRNWMRGDRKGGGAASPHGGDRRGHRKDDVRPPHEGPRKGPPRDHDRTPPGPQRPPQDSGDSAPE
jgi:hypothetical protein